MTPLTPGQAYTYALRLLGRRAFSAQELAGKLRRRGAEEEVVQEALGRLTREGWVDDAAYARAYVHDRLLFNPAGRRTLKAELVRRGVATEFAEEALSQLDRTAEEEIVRRLAAKRLRKSEHPGDEAERLRRWLLRRGFTYSVVAKILGSSLSGEDLPDEELEGADGP